MGDKSGQNHNTNKGKFITHNHMKHFLTLSVISGIKATLMYNFIALQWLKMKRANQNLDQFELSYIASGVQNGTILLENSLIIFK